MKPQLPKPREKLEHQLQPALLSDEELIALILSSGSAQTGVFTLAKKVLQQFGSLQQLVDKAEWQRLLTIRGVGPALASRLVASCELSKRLAGGSSHVEVRTPVEVLAQLPNLTRKRREYLYAFYLDTRHRLLLKRLITIGTLNQSIFWARDIFGEALRLPCAEVILAHNHPSGDCTPSQDDIECTQQVVAAGELLGVVLVDHLIIGARGHTSLRELGYLEATDEAP